MAQTVQRISSVLAEKTKKQHAPYFSGFVNSTEPETEDNVKLLFSICDSLNNLYIKLEMMNHVLEMKNIELQIEQQQKENASPHSGAVRFTSPHRTEGSQRLKKE